MWGLQAALAEAGALRLLSLFVAGGIAMQLLVGVVADDGSGARGAARADRPRAVPRGGRARSSSRSTRAGSSSSSPSPAAGASLAIYSLSLTILGERFAPRELANASAAPTLVLYQLGSMTGPVVAGTAMATVGGAGFVGTLALAGLACAGAALRGGAVRGVGSAAS